MSANDEVTRESLVIDPANATEKIVSSMRRFLRDDLKRFGVVIGLSGGIDSTVCAALSVRALGKERVFGLLMPERESSDETRRLSRMLAKTLGIEHVEEDLTPILDAAGCYKRRDDAVRSVVPEYGPKHSCKIVLPSVVDSDMYRVFSVVVRSPEGKETKARLSAEAVREIVAATNFKQRVRKMLEYHHADRKNYAVIGTPNRLEYDQGFFVKLGDGAADIKPIAHLYKTQVYALAKYLGVPDEIQSRPPTTDTYSLAQSQEEFYFSLPYDKMDLALYARSANKPAASVAKALGISPEQVERVYRDIDSKRQMAKYLHAEPLLIEEVAWS
jgi:NAD+ synthase